MKIKILGTLLYILINTITGYAQDFGRVEITLRLERQSLDGSNQYAVWIQDQDGEVVKTLFVTRYAAQGGYEEHFNCLPRWVNRANPRYLSQEEVDGFSGATPQNGWHTYIWDGTNRQGKTMPAGNYVFVVEGTYNWDSRVIYMGLIPAGGQEITVNAKPGYYPEEYTIFGSDMLGRVSATYIP